MPTVRRELEKVVQRFPGGRLIRVNPENPGLAKELVPKGVPWQYLRNSLNTRLKP